MHWACALPLNFCGHRLSRKGARTNTEDSMADEPNDKKPNDAKPQEDATELTEKDLASTAGGMLDGIRGESSDDKHKSE
jgi:hypothetical protein